MPDGSVFDFRLDHDRTNADAGHEKHGRTKCHECQAMADQEGIKFSGNCLAREATAKKAGRLKECSCKFHR